MNSVSSLSAAVCARNIFLNFFAENNRFIPVRPILRRNILTDDDQLQQQQQQQSQAVGVVLPSGPIFHDHRPAVGSPLSLRIPDGSAAPTTTIVTKNQAASNRNRKNNLEERLNQIQEYIQITTSLINSVQGEQVSQADYNFFILYKISIFFSSRISNLRDSVEITKIY